MKGKIGLVVGLGAGYVLGSRAGRERFEQIRSQWMKVWSKEPVQRQVAKAKDFVGDKASALPGAVVDGVVKLVKSATSDGTPGQRLDSTINTGKKVSDEVSDAAQSAAEDVAAKAKKAAQAKNGGSSAQDASSAKTGE